MRTVEGVDVSPTVLDARPAGCLNRSAYFQRQMVQIFLKRLGHDSLFAYEAGQIAVGADDIEAVIVDPDVRNVRWHESQNVMACIVQEPALTCSVKLQQR